MAETDPLATASDSDLVAFAGCKLIPVNNSMTVVINPVTGNQQAVAPQVVETIKACSEFNTIEAHTRSLVDTRVELKGQEAMVAATLKQLQDAGLLLTADEISQRLTDPTSSQVTSTRVFIITCDRPESAKRLLESILHAGQLSQHAALFLIDDSRVPENRALNRKAVIEFNLISPTDMYYVGEEEQQTLIHGLLEQLPEHADGVRFLLDRDHWKGEKTFGRARTLALLFSVGYRAIVLDDDVLCQAALPPIAEENVGFGSGSMRKSSFYPSFNNMLGNVTEAGFDPLSGHARLLGRTLGSALHLINDGPLLPEQLSGANAALANVLKANSPILVTQCGSLGDPGTGTHWVQHLSTDSVRRLLSAPQGVRSAIENRCCWLGSSRHNIFKMPFMSQVTGLDNSHLLPPYFPAYRGEDTLFGAMLVTMHASSVTLEYPWAVPHLPLNPKQKNMSSPIADRSGLMLLLARYLTEKIDYRDALSPENGLKLLAEDALSMSQRSDRDLLLDYRSALAAAHADQLRILSAKYDQTTEVTSTEWRDYLRRGIEEIERALVSSHSPTGISGVTEDATEESLLVHFRKSALGFAKGLLGWEETRKVSSDTVEEMIRSRSIYPL
ncbi:MAG: hypothetical protein AAGI44_14535 [Pseudomonadota bacterium]